MIYHDNCRPCRDNEARWDAQDQHQERLRQAERHHRQQMAQQRSQNARQGASWSGAAGAGRTVIGASSGFGLGGILLVALLFVPLLVIVMMVSALTVLVSLVTVILQGVVAAAVFGGAAGGITYVVQRQRSRDSQFHLEVPDKALAAKERVLGAYRSLDPVSQAAVKVGSGVGAAAFLLSVLF